MAVAGDLIWGESTATVRVGQTITVPVNSTSSKNEIPEFGPSAVASITSSTTTSLEITGNSVGTLTVPAGTTWTEESPAMDMETTNSFTLTVLSDDPKVATESMWENLASRVKAKADSTSLAIVATSGSYNDLSNKPTIPSIKSQTGSTAFSDISTLYVAGNGTTTTPMALKTHGDNSSGSYAYVNINEPTSTISSAYVGGYVWDNDESWWQKLPEVRLALYSDVPTITMTTTDPGEDASLAANSFIAVYDA